METNSPNIQDSFDDLFEHFSFMADVGQNPLRVDKFLMNRIENATRNKIQQAAKEGFIIVNNKFLRGLRWIKKLNGNYILYLLRDSENLEVLRLLIF